MQRKSDPPSRKPESQPPRASSRPPRADRLHDQYVTPMWRSPIFLGISGALVTLIVAGWVLWGIVERRNADRQFDAALTAMNGGQFEAAIEGFSRYLEAYPESEDAEKAVIWRGIARIKQHTESESASWPEALAVAKQFIADNRSLPFFRERATEVSGLVAKTAIGLATTARDRVDPASAEQSKEAIGLLERTFDIENRNQAQIDEVFGILTQAKLAIEKDGARNEALAAMEKRLADGDAMGVYAEHEKLFLRYPDLKTEPKATELREKARSLEREMVEFEAVTGEAPVGGGEAKGLAPAVTMVRRKAGPSAEKSGEIISALVADSLYAVDAGSGEALWRAPLGFEPAFMPTVVDHDGAKILAHRVSDQTIVLFDAASGKEIWRRSLGSTVLRNATRPAFQNGIAYLLAAEGSEQERGLLLQVRLSDGVSPGRFHFPQPLISAPVVDRNRDRVLVLGERSSLYVIDPSRRACEQVINLGHERDAIRCAPVLAGRFLFVAESAGLDSSLLRCLVLSSADGSARQSQVIPRQGWIWHSPYVLGGRLFLTTDHNHYSVFDLGGEEDSSPLTEILSSAEILQSRGEQPYPFATSESNFWTNGDRLLSYEIRVGNRRATANWETQLPGPPLQPPVLIGSLLIVTSLTVDSGLVTLIAMDPGSKEERWRLELGALPQALRVDGEQPDSLVFQLGSETIPLSPEQRLADQILEKPFPPPGTPRQGFLPLKRVQEWQEGTLEWVGVGSRRIYFAPPGEPARLVPVPASLAAKPGILENGLLIPGQDGLLYWIDPVTGTELAEPYVSPFAGSQPEPLGPVASVGAGKLVANVGNRLIGLELRDKPFPHFEETHRLELGDRKVHALAFLAGAVVAIVDDRVIALPAETLQPSPDLEEVLLHGIKLDASPQSALLGLQERALLLTQSGELLCLTVAAGKLTAAWRQQLPKRPVDEPLLLDETCWIPFADGHLEERRLSDGTVSGERSAGRVILDGPWKVGSSLVVLTPDGSLASIDLSQ